MVPPLRRFARMPRPFSQVDVFTATPYRGNPVAVVLDATGLADEEMQRFAHWTNLSETTFVLPPTVEGADYRVRIFTPVLELPFAGHPTLGTCHAWLEQQAADGDRQSFVQECGAGLVEIRRTPEGLAFGAPPLVRSGPVEEPLVQHIASVLGIDRADIVDAEWADNGPGSPEAFEVRAFLPKDGSTVEDPVTGSLNASLAQWLLRTGRATAPYVAAQGAALGRAGRVHVSQDTDGTIWVGGGTVTCVTGEVEL